MSGNTHDPTSDAPLTEGTESLKHPEEEAEKKKFGGFEGVFMPNLLTILGVIMFLRQGKIMGEAGLIYGLAIILIAHMVTVITGLSLSAVATNMRVRAGGAYYITSRSLGIEWGGCIGIPLALSQTLSIALYTLGFAESLRMISTVESLSFMRQIADYPMWLLGTVALGAMTLISFKGSSVVIKTQYLILFLVAVSLAAIFMGKSMNSSGPQLVGTFADLSFWQAFAIFFPAVTGIMAGVSLSGDLKNPRTAIPKGTMASVFVGLVVYISLGVFLCYYATPEQLSSDNAILLKIAWRPEAVLAGIWAATISSGLGMILAAPRTIQALALDGVLPSFLARTHGKNREPMIAMVCALLIAEGAILMGKLDLVAPVLSMFFLATYGMLNLISGLETLVQNPSYRPTIRVPWWLSLFGAGCCFYVMFLINTPATIVSIAVITIIYLMMKRRHLQATWGDLRRGFWLSLMRRALLQVERIPEHPKNWRPNIMVVTGIPQGRLDLVELADWLGSRRGLVTIRHVLVGPFEKLLKRRRMAINNLARFISDANLNALPAVDVVEDRAADLRKILSSQGFGSFSANTVLLDWNERGELNPGYFEKLCEGILLAEKTLLILHVDPDRKFGDHNGIAIWVDLKSPHLPIMLLLGYLISQDEDWNDSKIHLHVLGDSSTKDGDGSEAASSLKESRIPMKILFHPDMEGASINDRATEIVRRSEGADLLITPFPFEGFSAEEMLPVLEKADEAIGRLPSILMVRGQATVELSD